MSLRINGWNSSQIEFFQVKVKMYNFEVKMYSFLKMKIPTSNHIPGDSQNILSFPSNLYFVICTYSWSFVPIYIVVFTISWKSGISLNHYPLYKTAIEFTCLKFMCVKQWLYLFSISLWSEGLPLHCSLIIFYLAYAHFIRATHWVEFINIQILKYLKHSLGTVLHNVKSTVKIKTEFFFYRILSFILMGMEPWVILPWVILQTII